MLPRNLLIAVRYPTLVDLLLALRPETATNTRFRSATARTRLTPPPLGRQIVGEEMALATPPTLRVTKQRAISPTRFTRNPPFPAHLAASELPRSISAASFLVTLPSEARGRHETTLATLALGLPLSS